MAGDWSGGGVMAANPQLPRPQSVLSDSRNWPTTEWYEFWRQLLDFAVENGATQEQLAEIRARLDALENDNSQSTVIGQNSVMVTGDPDSGYVVMLLGDNGAPGNSFYYGTNASGVKGFYRVVDAEVAHLPGATYDTIQEFINVMNSPGLITGGTFSAAGSNLTVSAGTVAIRDVDDDVSTLYLANFPAAVLAIPNDSLTKFIGVERNGTNPQVILKATDTWNMDTEFPLGTVANLGGTLFPFYNPFKVGDPITNIIQRFDAQATIIRAASGGIILGNTGTRNATLSSGIAWARLNDYPITAKNSSVQTLIGIRPNPAPPPPLVFDLGLTQWPNTQYLSGTTLTTMTNNRWANLWFFVNIGTNAWGFAYGTAEYNNASLAAQEGIPAYLTENFLANNLLVGRYIFEKSSNTPIIESAFTRAFSTQAVSDHNQLSNLQGGALGEYYHLTAAQYAALGNPLQFATAMHIASMRP